MSDPKADFRDLRVNDGKESSGDVDT